METNQKVISRMSFRPKYLYKFYRPNERNFEDVKNRRVYLADPKYFNDPFDCKIQKIGYELKKVISKFIKNNRKRLSEKEIEDLAYSTLYKDSIHEIYNIIDKYPELQEDVNSIMKEKINNRDYRVASFMSFTQKKSLLKRTDMWAYYAQNGEGFCVKYNRNKVVDEIRKHILKVNYNDYVSMPNSKINLYGNTIEKYLLEKSTVWSHEKEWRLILKSNSEYLQENKISFPYAEEIYIGFSATKETKDKLIKISKYLNINCYLLEPHENERKFVTYKYNKD